MIVSLLSDIHLHSSDPGTHTLLGERICLDDLMCSFKYCGFEALSTCMLPAAKWLALSTVESDRTTISPEYTTKKHMYPAPFPILPSSDIVCQRWWANVTCDCPSDNLHMPLMKYSNWVYYVSLRCESPNFQCYFKGNVLLHSNILQWNVPGPLWKGRPRNRKEIWLRRKNELCTNSIVSICPRGICMFRRVC